MPESPVNTVLESAYRNDEPVLRARLEPLLSKRSASADHIGAVLRIIQRRKARIFAGRVGLGGALATLAAIAAEVAGGTPWERSTASGWGTLVLLGSVAATMAAYGLFTADPRGRLERDLSRLMSTSESLRADVERLSTDHDVRALRDEAASLEKGSVLLFVGAIGLLAPLTLHFFAWLTIGMLVHSNELLASYDLWIMASLVLVGMAHGSLFYRTVRLSELMAKTPDEELGDMARTFGWRTLGWTTLYSCFPGAIFWLVPVVIAFVTGALVIPFLFGRAGRIVALERAHLSPPLDSA